MCFLGISTLLIILLTYFTRLPVCLTCIGMESDVGVAEHLTDLLQIKSVYWFVLTCWHGHQHTLLNAYNSLADVCLQLCACLCVSVRTGVHGCRLKHEHSPCNNAKEEVLEITICVQVCGWVLSSKISEHSIRYNNALFVSIPSNTDALKHAGMGPSPTRVCGCVCVCYLL